MLTFGVTCRSRGGRLTTSSKLCTRSRSSAGLYCVERQAARGVGEDIHIMMYCLLTTCICTAGCVELLQASMRCSAAVAA